MISKAKTLLGILAVIAVMIVMAVAIVAAPIGNIGVDGAYHGDSNYVTSYIYSDAWENQLGSSLKVYDCSTGGTFYSGYDYITGVPAYTYFANSANIGHTGGLGLVWQTNYAGWENCGTVQLTYQ